MTDKKPLSKAKARKAVKKVKKKATGTVKKKSPRTKLAESMRGNQNALDWTDEKIEKICIDLVKAAKDEEASHLTLKQIAYACDSTYSIVYHLSAKYPAVLKAVEEVNTILQKRWLVPALSGAGHGSIIKQFLEYHSQEVTHFEDLREAEKAQRLDKIKEESAIRMEKVKADEKIRVVRALAEKVDDGNGNVLDEFDEFLEWKALRKAKKDL